MVGRAVEHLGVVIVWSSVDEGWVTWQKYEAKKTKTSVRDRSESERVIEGLGEQMCR